MYHAIRPLSSFFLSFCPERTVEGNAIQELFDIPQVIGGITEKCVEKSAFLFKFLAKSIVRADAIEGAELVKLLNNSLFQYRPLYVFI